MKSRELLKIVDLDAASSWRRRSYLRDQSYRQDRSVAPDGLWHSNTSTRGETRCGRRAKSTTNPSCTYVCVIRNSLHSNSLHRSIQDDAQQHLPSVGKEKENRDSPTRGDQHLPLPAHEVYYVDASLIGHRSSHPLKTSSQA